MKWHDNSTYPEPLTEFLCEYTKDGIRFYAFLIAYTDGTWLNGIDLVYNQHEITRWCPIDEVVSALNGE